MPCISLALRLPCDSFQNNQAIPSRNAKLLYCSQITSTITQWNNDTQRVEAVSDFGY
jgi:hypothetical protein